MAKSRIKTCLFNQTTKEEIKTDIIGIENENKIIYFLEGKKVIWDKKRHILKKQVGLNELIVISFDTENPIAYCKLNETKFYFDINIYKMKCENNKIEIDYKINDERITFELESVIE